MPFTAVQDDGTSSKPSNSRRTSDTEPSQPLKASTSDVNRSPDSAKTVRRQQRDELASLFGGEFPTLQRAKMIPRCVLLPK